MDLHGPNLSNKGIKFHLLLETHSLYSTHGSTHESLNAYEIYMESRNSSEYFSLGMKSFSILINVVCMAFNFMLYKIINLII